MPSLKRLVNRIIQKNVYLCRLNYAGLPAKECPMSIKVLGKDAVATDFKEELFV